MSERARAIIELAVAAAGLGVYLVLLGGMQVWAKLEAAGLPGDIALAGYDTRSLTANGLRALAVLPVAALVLLVLERFSGRGHATVADKASDVALHVVVALGGLTLAVYVGAFGLDAATALREAWWVELAVVAGSFLAPALAWVVIRTAVWLVRRVRGGAAAGAPAADGTEARTFNWVRKPVSSLRRLGGRKRVAAGGVMVLSAGVLAAVALLAAKWVSIPLGVLTLTLLGVAYVLAAFAAAAALADAAAEIRRSQRLDGDSALLLALFVAAYVLPLWVGAWLVGLGLLVLLVGPAPAAAVQGRPGWYPTSAGGRAVLLGVLVVVASIAFGTRSPQRFDRVQIPVEERGTPVDAALLGRSGKQVLLGVCVRQADGTSADVEVLRVAESNVPLDRVTAGRYAFYRGSEPTLLSGLSGALGLPAFRPPALDAWLRDEGPEDVCADRTATPAWMLEQLRTDEPAK